MQIMEFKDRIGVSRPDVENWLRTIQNLTSTFAPTKPGVPRDYSRENVLELAVISAVRNAGCPLQTAASYARVVIQEDRLGRGHPRGWFAFPAGNFSEGRAVANPANVDFEVLAGLSPSRGVSLIYIGKIVETVDGLFAKMDGK